MRFVIASLLALAAAGPLLAQEMKMPTTAPGAPIAARAVTGTYKVIRTLRNETRVKIDNTKPATGDSKA